MNFNSGFNNLTENYLFAEIANRVSVYEILHPDKKIFKLGIGDVTLPLARAVTEAMHSAVEEMGKKETFQGYLPYEGCTFLRESIRGYYSQLGVKLALNEIFASDGAKSDLGNILDIFSKNNTALIPDPVYPAYVDANVISGREIVFMDATEANGFLPMPDYGVEADIVYICSPNNPTGAAYSLEQLKEWADYANKKGAVILYDAAYESFVSDEKFARSIFQVEGARTCAIEFCSFSKTAGFTGTRCGYTVVPEELKRGGLSANKLWLRRQSAKFNGVSYIVQKGASAVFTKRGISEIQSNLRYYKQNAEIISGALNEIGITYWGGKNSPYIWLKCPYNMGSWEFFDYLLDNAQVVGTPGAGFGATGEGYFRLTSFGSRENTLEAVERIKKIF